MTCKERLEAYLREKGVPYQSQHHARAITAQEVAAAEHVPGRMFAKTVIVTPDDEVNMVMLVLPAPYHVNPLKASAALGVSEVPLYVDRALAEDETIVFRSGTHTDTMSVSYEDFEKLVRPTVADFADPFG